MAQNLGPKVREQIHKTMKDQRISVIMDKTIQDIKGETKIESISFIDREKAENPGNMFKEGITEYFIKPDMVIVENGLGSGKVDIKPLIDPKDEG